MSIKRSLAFVLLAAVLPAASAAAQRKPVPFATFRAFPLDSTVAQVERAFGKPLRRTKPVYAPGGELYCLEYVAAKDAAPATRYQLCFDSRGRVHGKYAG